MDNSLTRDRFAEHVNSDFTTDIGTEVFQLRLIEVENLPEPAASTPETRAPFSLLFQGPPEMNLEQRIFRLEHEVLGTMEIFLVPMQPDSKGTYFEAVFT